MTIEEAINHAKKVSLDKRSEKPEHVIGLLDDSDCKKCADQHEQLAEWLEELQQYRAIGTVDYIYETILLTKADETLLSEYKAIGKVEECRKAMEQGKKKKPRVNTKRYKHLGHEFTSTYYCPNCKEQLINKDGTGFYDGEKTDFCTRCGKAIDWSDE